MSGCYVFSMMNHCSHNNMPAVLVNSLTDAVNAGPLCPAGTMRKMDVSSVGRTTGLSLGSCVMAALRPSQLGSSW